MQMESVPERMRVCKAERDQHCYEQEKAETLVDNGIVDGWDDPRLPTISGLRRRGYTPDAIKSFCREIGVSKSNSLVDEQMLQHFIREDLKVKAPELWLCWIRLN